MLILIRGKEDGMAYLPDITRRLTAHRKKLRPSKARALLEAGLIVLLVGVIAFAVYQVARHMTVGLNTLRTQEILDETYVRLELYLFRDEQLLYAEGSDACLYEIENGERVGVGQTIGTAYAVGDAAVAAELQTQLDLYGVRIALLEDIGGLGTPADARAEADAVDRAYLALLEAASRGDLAAVDGLSDRMLDGLGRYDILTGAVGGVTVASLRAEREALMASYAPVAQLVATRSGNFCYEADGYESVFRYESAMTMTPEEFRAMTVAEAASVPAGVVGKLVYSPKWYAAAYVPLSDEAIELFQQGVVRGASYTMRCGGSDGTTVTMTIERMVPDENGALLVFSCRDLPADVAYERCIRAETVFLSVSGYRIPEEALVTLPAEGTGEPVEGVYILSGNVVEFRKVRRKVKRDGYIIAESYEEVQALLESLSEEEQGKLTADGWEFLALNDNIITSGNELYEGKVIS